MEKKIIVYVDESGESSAHAVDNAYPVFVLACCVFEVETYIREVVPAFQKLKFDWFGHDQVVFHSSDIRRRRGDFKFLLDPEKEAKFAEDLTSFVSNAEFEIYAECVSKVEIIDGSQVDFYPGAVISSLTKIRENESNGHRAGAEHAVVFESRGRQQDDIVRNALASMNWRGPSWFSSKQALSTGLQIADLVARPIGINALGRINGNAPFDAIYKKLR